MLAWWGAFKGVCRCGRSRWLMGGASFLLLVALAYRAARPQVINGLDFRSLWKTAGPLYKLDISWPKFPGQITGQTFCVAVDPIYEIVYVGQRGNNVPKVLVFSEEGYLLQAWNTSVEMPHGIFAASTPNLTSVWITDVGTGKYGHTIQQYSSSGKLLQVIGTPGKAGSGVNPLQFDQPAEIFVEETGDLYIVDGDGGMNNRLVKLTPDFKTLWLRGENGTGVAQFRIPHSVTVDSVGRVWVADRGNQRIQVFDKTTGEWLGSWSSCFREDSPYSVRFSADEKYVIVAHLNTDKISILAAPPIGSIGNCDVVDIIQLAENVKPHLVDVSMRTGAVYVAEIGAEQVQRYVPID
ncbi:NHL repeat-containing protein 3 [Tiliqua scincoides]|uniref:NHL repeat-containing protein 3 n=1 Tax=Tiliqua scincoides TaxID=71010 RepID=UPI0034621046